MHTARALFVLAVAWPAITQGQACQGDTCPAVSPQRVAARLAARLSDEELAATIIELLAACDGREECALSMEQGAVAAAANGHPLDGVDEERAAPAEVKGLDTWVPGTGFRLLFGTPFFSTTLDGAERMNDELAALIDREQASAYLPSTGAKVASQQRSMSGGSSFRTDDHFLTRPEPAVRELHRQLMVHAEQALQFGQPRRLELRMEIHGWAISHGQGGSQVPHVHPIAQWSGVYYVRVPARVASGSAGGCLRVTDPRPAAMMVTLG